MFNEKLISKLNKKKVLANILCYLCDEFKGIPPDKAEEYIQQETVVNKGLTIFAWAILPDAREKISLFVNILDLKDMIPKFDSEALMLATHSIPEIPEICNANKFYIASIFTAPREEYRNSITDYCLEITACNDDASETKKKQYFFASICLDSKIANSEIPIIKFLAKEFKNAPRRR